MKRLIPVLIVSVAACKSAPPEQAASAPAQAATEAPKEAMAEANPLLGDAWTTPYGTPPFSKIKMAHYAPALETGMKQHLVEISKIAHDAAEPTFANTIEAIEKSGQTLERAARVFFNLSGTDSTPEFQKLRAEFAPKLSKHEDALYLNPKLWERVKFVYGKKDELKLNPQQLKLLEDMRRQFVRAGADLPEDKKKRLSDISARLAGLYTEYGDSLRNENADYALVIEDKKDLEGLPDEVIAVAASEAKTRKMEGKWAFTLVRSSCEAFLRFAKNRKLRQEIYTAYVKRGTHGNKFDRRENIKESTKLRAERAQLLGYKTHAHYNIDRNMAKTPEAVHELLGKLWKGALKRAKGERKDLQAMLRKDLGRKAKLEAWDWSYYAEKVRKAKYDLSEKELKPYFQVDAVRKGAFDVASRLFGITFEEVTAKVPTYHPEVKAFDVKNKDGSHVGLLYVDYHPRAGKRGGAWMTVFRPQSNAAAMKRPVVLNVGNFPAPAGDKPALLGWSEVETLFHEFGHALHGLLSDVHYASQAGTAVKRDYVEFPSQVLENWASEPSVIKGYAKHFETGEPIPDALVAKIQKASTFNQGFDMTELVGAALLDLEWHNNTVETAGKIDDVEAFDTAAMKKIGLIPEISPRYHAGYFQHIFAGDGYSANYYVYMWAQVLEADCYRAFEEKKDPFDPELAAKLREHIFSSGGSEDEMALYRKFRGRNPVVDPLLEKRGLK